MFRISTLHFIVMMINVLRGKEDLFYLLIKDKTHKGDLARANLIRHIYGYDAVIFIGMATKQKDDDTLTVTIKETRTTGIPDSFDPNDIIIDLAEKRRGVPSINNLETIGNA